MTSTVRLVSVGPVSDLFVSYVCVVSFRFRHVLDPPVRETSAPSVSVAAHRRLRAWSCDGAARTKASSCWSSEVYCRPGGSCWASCAESAAGFRRPSTACFQRTLTRTRSASVRLPFLSFRSPDSSSQVRYRLASFHSRAEGVPRARPFASTSHVRFCFASSKLRVPARRGSDVCAASDAPMMRTFVRSKTRRSILPSPAEDRSPNPTDPRRIRQESWAGNPRAATAASPRSFPLSPPRSVSGFSCTAEEGVDGVITGSPPVL